MAYFAVILRALSLNQQENCGNAKIKRDMVLNHHFKQMSKIGPYSKIREKLRLYTGDEIMNMDLFESADESDSEEVRIPARRKIEGFKKEDG